MIPGQYSNAWDPQNPQADQTPDQGQQPTPSTGGTKGGLMGQWNDFMSEPANRAGLMQFGINMLAGQGLAGGLGGFGEASSRNIAAQEEEEKQAEEESLKERAQATKESEAESYGIGQRRRSGMDEYYAKQGAREDALLRQEGLKGFNTWKADLVGGGGIMSDVTKRYPNVKSKEDLDKAGNEEALRFARQRYLETSGYGSGEPQRPQFTPPQGAIPRRDPKTGHTFYYDQNRQLIPGQI